MYTVLFTSNRDLVVRTIDFGKTRVSPVIVHLLDVTAILKNFALYIKENLSKANRKSILRNYSCGRQFRKTIAPGRSQHDDRGEHIFIYACMHAQTTKKIDF